MCFNKPKNPTKSKKVVYILAWVALGLILSLLLHVWIEMNYLSRAEIKGISVPFYHGCALPPWLQIALALDGIIGGYLLGCFFWRKVYIENIRAKKHR